jgi:chromosome partitioning protein
MNQNIITLVCNKGGVGRSTTAQNVSWKLAELGYEVLVVDLDSQANTSITLALDYEQQVIQAGKSITNMLNTTDRFFSDFIINTRNPKVDLLASTLMLDNTENNIDSIAKEKYHFIIFDTPPRKTDRFIHNALVMSNFYWYIVSAENRWSLDTKPFMDKVINDIAKGHSVEIEPIPALITKFRKANKLSHLVREQCQILFEEEGIMDATIRDTTHRRKASAMYKAIYEFDRRTDVAKDYESATTELIDYCKVHNK